jgi:hypothetical protein
MLGTDPPRCRNHLGQPPDLVKANYLAQRQAKMLFDQAVQTARREGLDLIDPLGELHKLAGEVLMWRDVCRTLVGELPELRYKAGASGEQLRSEVALYERSLERAEKILADLVRLGIEERIAKQRHRLNAEAAVSFVVVMDRIVDQFGLYDSVGRDVFPAIAREFRAVDDMPLEDVEREDAEWQRRWIERERARSAAPKPSSEPTRPGTDVEIVR